MRTVSSTYLFFSLILFLAISCTTGHRMVNYDISEVYHPDKTTVKKKIFHQKDSLKIFLSYYNPHDYLNLSIQEFLNNYKFIYKITYDHYSSDVLTSDSIVLKQEDVYAHDNSFSFSFSIPKINTSSAVLIIYKKDLKRSQVDITDMTIDFSKKIIGTNYLLINQKNNSPILDNYLVKQDTVLIQTSVPNTDSLWIYHYDQQLSPAAPPMVLTNKEKETLKEETSYKIKINEPLTFRSEGLYLLKQDTSSDDGLSFVVKDYKYPNLSRAEEMIETLVYLTTAEEQKKLESSGNKKASLDSFWLKIGGSKEYSKQMIKSYYRKVEYANKAFTTYKEGWKTDRGIIYIIFGKPDQVYKWEDKEEWLYENILSQIVSFSFIKRPTIFSDEHYELVRNSEYERYWNLTIEKWRSGIITK